jgi:hypothetical protein
MSSGICFYWCVLGSVLADTKQAFCVLLHIYPALHSTKQPVITPEPHFTPVCQSTAL